MWMDNYAEMALAEFITFCNTSCVKTIKIHRQALPVKMKATEGQGYQAAWVAVCASSYGVTNV